MLEQDRGQSSTIGRLDHGGDVIMFYPVSHNTNNENQEHHFASQQTPVDQTWNNLADCTNHFMATVRDLIGRWLNGLGVKYQYLHKNKSWNWANVPMPCHNMRGSKIEDTSCFSLLMHCTTSDPDLGFKSDIQFKVKGRHQSDYFAGLLQQLYTIFFQILTFGYACWILLCFQFVEF